MNLIRKILSLTLLASFSVIYSGKPEKLAFVLITSLYNETDAQRANEYITCLEKNLSNGLIRKIHVLYDTTVPGESIILNYLIAKNIEITYIQGRPSYQQCFTLANTLYPLANIILTNADIYFNNTLRKLKNYKLINKILALTRWNVHSDGTSSIHRNKYEKIAIRSQDTWIFKSIPFNIPCNDIYLGTKHCDGRIAFEAKKAKVKILNPCLSIKCHHLHLSDIRHYETNQPLDATNTAPVKISLLRKISKYKCLAYSIKRR